MAKINLNGKLGKALLWTAGVGVTLVASLISNAQQEQAINDAVDKKWQEREAAEASSSETEES